MLRIVIIVQLMKPGGTPSVLGARVKYPTQLNSTTVHSCEYLPHIGDCNVANPISLNITEESAITIRSAAQNDSDLIDYHRLDLGEGEEERIYC